MSVVMPGAANKNSSSNSFASRRLVAAVVEINSIQVELRLVSQDYAVVGQSLPKFVLQCKAIFVHWVHSLFFNV